MVKLNKIYTKTGDAGTTSLVGGLRIHKSAQRIAAMGALDELNSQLGFALALLDSALALPSIKEQILIIQNTLFNIGAQWSTHPDAPSLKRDPVTIDDITTLENHIDTLNSELPALTSFVLPGGSVASSAFHVARSVCRRAEHLGFALNEQEPDTLHPDSLVYINRLSDWVFVAARFINHTLNIKEPLWTP